MCENLVLKETPTDKLLRTARFLPALHSLYTFAHAYRNAWKDKCKGVSGSCLNLRRMTRREFVEMYLEPLGSNTFPRTGVPRGARTEDGSGGERRDGRDAARLSSYSFRTGGWAAV
ncbi:metabotropic glutamate receptor 3 [Caerostris extrusa]|uniref:Metabotropic glutamate receptor 3 n=1 Tax=Caerostris extrusa TaxID=172846 RepID=A0AAV4YC09_CAEEX|nr:metabotropic glutamate receptor 3 [Caerostris extrusa]